MTIASCAPLMLFLLTGVVAPVTEVNTLTSGGTVWPHPRLCAQFYNSSAPAQSWYWEDHLQECPYTQVFDTETLGCKHYTEVNCGDRIEPLGPCDYRVNQCERSHCIPCNVRYAVCKGLPDGFNWNPAKPGSPFFMYCEGGRTRIEGNCMSGVKSP